MTPPGTKLRVVEVRLLEDLMHNRNDTLIKCRTFDGGTVDTWGMIHYGEGWYWLYEDVYMRDYFDAEVLRWYNSYLDNRSWGYDGWIE